MPSHFQEAFDQAGAVVQSAYVNYNTAISFLCKCGTPHRITPKSIRTNGAVPRCPECTRLYCQAKKREGSPLGIEDVRALFSKGQAVLLDDEYKGTVAYYRFRCRCGAESKVKYGNLLSGNTAEPLCRPWQIALKFKRGPENPRWNPNLTDEQRQDILRHSRSLPGLRKAVKAWREQVLRMHNHRCALTGSTQDLEVHHLYNWAHYPDRRFDPANEVVLTKELHTRFHRIYGKGYNTLDQYLEFVETMIYLAYFAAAWFAICFLCYLWLERNRKLPYV